MATVVLPQPILGPMPVHSNNRRIRFAPLPDPRRSVDGHLGYPPTPSPTAADSRSDYFTLDNSSSSSSSKLSGTATPISTTPSESSSVPPSPLSCPTSPFATLTTKLNAVSSPPPTTTTKSRPFQSFFRSLKRSSATSSSSSSSSTTLTPVHSIDRTQTPTFSRRNFSAEEILTLGTINLFRASSSREPHSDSAPSPSSSTWSLTSLTRWTSGGSSHSHKEPSWGSPLARASSTQSYQSPSKSSKPIKKTLRPVNRKGTRMLNGRVYGVKRNANPFANARDEEPTFVEWGYGGMGSVRGATSAGAQGWERLHGHPSSAAHPSQPTKDEDEDDGSGMAWIKKRREQREKEKKEKEDLEKVESSDLQTPLLTPPSVPTLILPPLERKQSATRLSSRPGTASSARTVLSNSSSLTVTPSPTPFLSIPSTPGSRPGTAVSSHSNSTVTPGDEQVHLTRAVTVPAPHRYHHHRSHSRSASKDLKELIATESNATTTPPTITVKDEKKDVEKSESESESSDAERESSSEDYEEDSEEEEEEEEEERRRKTALGAGVEKISRHH